MVYFRIKKDLLGLKLVLVTGKRRLGITKGQLQNS